ncbi:MAG: hypothetical protein IJN82_05805 [Clostridia bacterium]|nr:hypothetical protein [Clostridia bacterium]
MRFYCKIRLVLGGTAAFGWFALHDIPYTAVLFLIPLGLAYYYFTRNRNFNPVWLNGLSAAVTAVISAYVVAVGLFEGKGTFSLVCLLFAVGIGTIGISKTELSRISGWWVLAFVSVYLVMFIATIPGIEFDASLPPRSNWKNFLIFYVLAFIEPLGMGREYRGAPIVLGLLLIPFGFAAYFALGEGAFALAQYPYLSVWSGVAVSAFHHLEGIILCLYFGAAAFRIAHFFADFKKTRCIRLGDVL